MWIFFIIRVIILFGLIVAWKTNVISTEISPKKQKIVDSIKLQVNMQMEDVTVQIENDIRPIAALEVCNLRRVFTMK